MKKITAYEYWTKYLKNCLYWSGWLPDELLYLITNVSTLQKKITNEDVIEWYNTDEEENLDSVLDEILIIYGVDEDYFSQTSNVVDLEELINEYYYVEIIDDEHCYIKKK